MEGALSTKTTSSAVESLQEQLAKLQKQIAELTQESYAVSEAVVRRFTAQKFHDARMFLVVHDQNNKPVLAKGTKGYALKKGVEPSLYFAIKGLEGTLKAREAKGEPVELSAKLNDKGRSQIMFAQETIAKMVEGGWINRDSAILQEEPKARKSSKKSA